MNRHANPGSIAEARQAAGLSQMALADRAGLSLSTVERIENGKIKTPHPATLQVIEWAIERERLRQRNPIPGEAA